jgi:hypothetical protein
MKDLVGQSDEVCQKLHVKENDLNYLKKGRLGMLCMVKICLKIVGGQNLDHLFHDLN